MSCIPASHSMITALNTVASQMEDSPAPRRGSKVYQLFPESLSGTDSELISEEMTYRRERLPSIVLEPTEQSEVECGGQQWALHRCRHEGDEEGEDGSAEHVQDSLDGGQREEMGIDVGSTARKSSIGQGNLAFSRLTPPSSITTPEAAPPCLRS